MQAVIDAIYENGVLKPLTVSELKEHQHYRLTLREINSAPSNVFEEEIDPELAAELERRTTILPDGRTIIRLAGLFHADLSDIREDQDPVADALAELRRERAKRFDEEWPPIKEEVQ